MRLYEDILRPLLFRMDPETAHNTVESILSSASRSSYVHDVLAPSFTYTDSILETEIAGIKFPNPVGLAAGFDKDCCMANILPAFGFGSLELGTITLRPQPGNPKPRLFRFPESQALINRMGFNNNGADRALENLRKTKHTIPIGINLGLNKDAYQGDAPEYYSAAFTKLCLHGDYFTINVSSPNTEGLRRLQDKLRLERILRRIAEFNGDKKPIFVKLSPDLSDKDLESLLPMLEENASGVICTNTTLSRPDVDEEAERLRGGLSGAPLRDLSTQMIRTIYKRTNGRLPIIGVGGIFTAEDAYQKIRAGARAVQLYTSFIYHGPSLPSRINRGLAGLLRKHGLRSLSEAVGQSHTEVMRTQ